MQHFLKALYQYSQTVSEACLPSHCLLCNLPSKQSLICSFCYHSILTERSCCLHCGCGLTSSQAHCGECLRHPFNFHQLHAIANYQSPFPELIKQLKYNNQLLYADLLGLLLAESVKQRYPSAELEEIDYLIPIPLHNKKHRSRGFNQTQLIANTLIKQIPLTIAKQKITRNKLTKPQEGLTRVERTHNLKEAFSLSTQAKEDLQGKYIVLLDDVVTTGATINSLCQTLIAANVKRIDVWCICRTELQ